MRSLMKEMSLLLIGFLIGFGIVAIGAELQQRRLYRALAGISDSSEIQQISSAEQEPDLFDQCIKAHGNYYRVQGLPGADGLRCVVHWLPAEPVRQLFPK